jgi:antitoxin MazE
VLLEVLEATVKSAYTRNKQQALQRANLRLEVARHLWRLSHVFQAIIRCPFNYLIAEHSMFILMSKQVFFMRWAVMNEVVLDIKQWGNNLGVRLPAAIARAAHLHVHQRVRLSVADGNIIITPVPDEPLTLEQRLADYDPVRHGGEVMNTRQGLGAEEW